MTIYDLKRLNIANGGKFFDRAVMRSWGDTMKNFGIEKVTFNTVRVYRKRSTGKPTGKGVWLFNSVTGRMIL